MAKIHPWKNMTQNYISLSVSNTLHYSSEIHPYVGEFILSLQDNKHLSTYVVDIAECCDLL